jgi:uncharacterized membrane protein
MDIARRTTLIGAVITVGLMAGLFYAYACSVMLGLGRSSDRTFVEAMQRINESIQNGVFFLCFVGALVLSVAALVLDVRTPGHAALGWVIAGVVLYAAVLAITAGINIPLNNTLDAAGPVDRIADLATVRAHFETTWVRWNIVRAVLCTGSFGCLVWALRCSTS